MKNLRFYQKLSTLTLATLLLFSLSGCVYMVIGGLGAVGGYAVSSDTIEGVLSYDQLDTWDATKEVVSIMGVIEEDSEESGVVIAKINGAKVTINIISLTDENTKIRIKARKALLPKISTAQDVYVKIVGYLEN